MPTLVEQLRGATKLAVEATKSVTDLVEAMHVTIGGGPDVLGRPLEAVTRLISGPTYDAIRGVAGAVGSGLELALKTLEPMVQRAGADRGFVLAALNGVMGDYLEETKNPLAIKPCLCSGGEALVLTKEALAAKFPSAPAKVLVLVHGSSADDSTWLRPGPPPFELGRALAPLGFAPIYVRYNSGLHVSENGRTLSVQLDELVRAWPTPIEELVFLAHSMGGLVCRSACLLAEREGGHAWRARLRKLITLGTPHHGAPLERGGAWLEVLLGASRYSAPLSSLGRLRSAGVTDLRYGFVLDEHWQGKDRFANEGDSREHLELPAGVKCFAVAASTSEASAANPSGDGLVPIDSALGRHPNPRLQLTFDEVHLEWGCTHLGLLGSQPVFEKVRGWLSP